MTGKRNWLRILSPCILASAFLVFAVILSLTTLKESGGWSFLGVIIGVPLLLIFLLADLFAKAIISKTLVLWIVELLVIALTLFLYHNHIYG